MWGGIIMAMKPVGVEIETRICWVVVVPSSDVLPFTTGEVINLDGGFYIRRL